MHSVLRCPLFEKFFCDTTEQDKPTIPAHYYFFFFIPRESEGDRGSSGFIPIPALVILCLADNTNVKMVPGISIKGSTN